jgi:predicted GNAT family acetyltransferase
MKAITILHHDNVHGGCFKAVGENNAELGEMTYRWLDESKIIIDHTGVAPEYEGSGIGKQLIMEGIAFARSRQLKVVPHCSFAKTLFERLLKINNVKHELLPDHSIIFN